MEPGGRLGASQRAGLYSWDSEFTKRKPAHLYLEENKKHFRYKYEASGGRSSFIRTVMEDSCASERFLCRAEHVESFCGKTDPSSFIDQPTQEEKRPIALIDDRKADLIGISEVAETGICREHKGPLNPRQLHQELCKPRYTTGGTFSTGREAATTGAEPGLVDAERRLIYITDLDPDTVIALLDTVSFSQAHFLRDFIYNHLVFNPLLRVSIPIGFKRFALEFHLPYFAWRKGSGCVRDERRMSDGRTLRRSQDLGFLDLTPSGTPSPQHDNSIYEAQMSCLVAGTGDASWVAYGIFDTYQNGTQDEESATYYHERACIPDQAPMDPLSGGKIMADCPVWDPRIYFLQVLESRIEQVKEEWINIVHRVQQKTCPYTQDHQVFKNLYLSPDTENRGERLKRFYEWTGSTTRLLMELIDVLSKTTHAWDHFQSREIEYFLDVNQHGDKPSPSPYLKAITKHIEEMKAQLLALQYQEKVCSNILREVRNICCSIHYTYLQSR
ncbi:hypothetical protein F4809DRAFT_585985 [Biscogniauxia mediterranea]|nr:hypothetical protein F4809DRAFT_585985 [Biscogniauxia mediterranea]